MKRGVSLLIVTTAVTIMIILISAASVIGSGAISTANFEEYKSLLNRVSDSVNNYYLENGELPVKNQVVNAASLGEDFVKDASKKEDMSNKLFVVDMDKMNDASIKKGRGTVESQDVFLVAENTQNIYYMKGYKYKSVVYFGI